MQDQIPFPDNHFLGCKLHLSIILTSRMTVSFSRTLLHAVSYQPYLENILALKLLYATFVLFGFVTIKLFQ
jgi:hypothetical protein